MMAVSKRTRYEVLKRDNHTCRYCGSSADDGPLTIDHVVPVSLGGTDDPANLIAACRDCNAGKSSSHPNADMVADVEQRALRWAAAMKLAADRMVSREQPQMEYAERAEDFVLMYLGKEDLPTDWRDSFSQFYRAGLPVEMYGKAIAIATTKENVAWSQKWRYAMGIAWTMVREMQDEARAILEDGLD